MNSENMQCGGRSLHFWKESKEVNRSKKSATFIQQDDLFKDRMSDIYKGGLRYAWAKQYSSENAEAQYQKKVDPAKDQQNVIVVGAGMSGLVIAYELAQIGHNVTILELQNSVGGRIKTFYHGFADGGHSEGGAMRLPPNHFLTHHYCKHFRIELQRWQNYQPNASMYLYGDKIKMGVDYFEQTIAPVMKELGEDPSERDWTSWVAKWSKFSTEEFLRSATYKRPDKLKIQPWPEKAINGYKVSSYSPNISESLVETLRDILGGWWRDKLQTPKKGMSALPNAFLNKNDHGWNKDVELRKNVVYGFKVQSITKEQGSSKLKVSGMNVTSGNAAGYQCDAVFVTVPLNILRQIDIPFLDIEKQQAIAGATYDTATRVMLQCKKRFWQEDVGQGGFSKTSGLIGQLHYPDDDKSDNDRGILLVYSWAQDALALGSQSHEEAIQTAVREISKIHPEMKDWFEVGKVQAWYSDPAAQGGYAALQPYEYLDHQQSLWKSEHPLYLAGEAISWSNGWIQGALFSGLSQAFAFQSHLEASKGASPGNAEISDILKC